MVGAEEPHEHVEDIIEIDGKSLGVIDVNKYAEDGSCLEKLRVANKSSFYTDLILVLLHESLDNAEAKQIWHASIEHMHQLNELLGRKVGITVAMLDYLQNLREEFPKATIISEDKVDFLTRSSVKDELTGLYNREIFSVVFNKEVGDAQRNGRSIALIMMDIDNFKTVNDTHGHPKGDEVLRLVGKIVRTEVRKMDLAARYGGEELVVLMPGTTLQQAEEVAERIRARVELAKVSDISVTLSLGVSVGRGESIDENLMLERADSALYLAKNAGKNRVCIEQK